MMPGLSSGTTIRRMFCRTRSRREVISAASSSSPPICSMPACIMRDADRQMAIRWPSAISQMVP